MKQIIQLKHDTPVNTQVDAVIERLCPTIRGWRREIQRGGVLCNANVTYTRETTEFRGSIVAWINVDDCKTRPGLTIVTVSFSGWLAEFEPMDGRYYSWDGSFLSNCSDLTTVRAQLFNLAEERRASRRDF